LVFSSLLCVLCVKAFDLAAEGFNKEDTEKNKRTAERLGPNG
jgi:hypothetical protein